MGSQIDLRHQVRSLFLASSPPLEPESHQKDRNQKTTAISIMKPAADLTVLSRLPAFLPVALAPRQKKTERTCTDALSPLGSVGHRAPLRSPALLLYCLPAYLPTCLPATSVLSAPGPTAVNYPPKLDCCCFEKKKTHLQFLPPSHRPNTQHFIKQRLLCRPVPYRPDVVTPPVNPKTPLSHTQDGQGTHISTHAKPLHRREGRP